MGREWRKEVDVTKNAMGQTLNSSQQEIAGCYERLAALLEDHRGELLPFEERNVTKAVACLWQVMNGLDMDPGNRYDIGI